MPDQPAQLVKQVNPVQQVILAILVPRAQPAQRVPRVPWVIQVKPVPRVSRVPLEIKVTLATQEQLDQRVIREYKVEWVHKGFKV
jgi:hypothetical protein